MLVPSFMWLYHNILCSAPSSKPIKIRTMKTQAARGLNEHRISELSIFREIDFQREWDTLEAWRDVSSRVLQQAFSTPASTL